MAEVPLTGVTRPSDHQNILSGASPPQRILRGNAPSAGDNKKLIPILNVPLRRVPYVLFSYLRWIAINFFLPFVNGIMLGAGEITAHELAYKWGFRNGPRILPPSRMGLSGASSSFSSSTGSAVVKKSGVKVVVGESTFSDRID